MTRLSINISDETADSLRSLAAAHDTTVTDIVRRSVSLYKYLADQLDDPHKSLQMKGPRGRVTGLALL